MFKSYLRAHDCMLVSAKNSTRMNVMILSSSRNPIAAYRPAFRDILLTLLGSLEELASFPPAATDTHHLTRALGSPLDADENMYRDLQYRYVERDNELD